MNQDTYDLFEEFVNSDFIDKVIEGRIRQSILDLRFSIDAIEHRNRTQGGLPSYIRQDLEVNWQDLDALTRAYIYYSGDYELERLPEWEHKEEFEYTPGWDYWNQGDVK